MHSGKDGKIQVTQGGNMVQSAAPDTGNSENVADINDLNLSSFA
jgi:hypothetical protein